MILFLIALIVSGKNLTAALISIAVFSFFWILFFDIRNLTLGERITFSLSKEQFRTLFINTFPLFLSLFSQVFIFNMPKYAIDTYMSVESQAIYGILFMPASIVSLLATFLYRPIMVQLSLKWDKGEYKDIIRTCFQRILLVLAAIVIIVAGGALLGTQVLTILYGTDVNAFRKELLILLVGGGFSGISVLLYYLMTIVRKQYYMVGAHFIILILSWIASYKLVESFGMFGASLGYLFAIMALDIILFFMLTVIFHRKMKGSV